MAESPRAQVVLITGCSSGFGYLCALRLAADGHIVHATMRDPAKGELLLSEARRLGCESRIHILRLDVTQPAQIREVVNEIVSEHGVIDVLVNNAGFGIGGFFEDLSADDYQKQFDVNFFGVLNVTREVIPVMRPRRRGKIINISSMASFSGTPCFSAYCSSKWALEGFSECLYMELSPLGVSVALVEPGAYRTRIFEENARYGSRFEDPESPYFETSRRLRQWVIRHVKENHRDPQEVAITISKIIMQKDPAFRNVIGWSQRLRVAFVRLVPFKLYAWLVNAVMFPETSHD